MIWLTYSPVAETTKRYYKLCTTEAECTNESGGNHIDQILSVDQTPHAAVVPPVIHNPIGGDEIVEARKSIEETNKPMPAS